MTVLYIIAIMVMSFAVVWSGFVTIYSIWKQKAAAAIGTFIAFLFNSLITFLLLAAVL